MAMSDCAQVVPVNQESNKSRVFVQWNDHARHLTNALCSQIEHQSFVDLAIICGSNTMHVHKSILVANSGYFKEQLEKNPEVEQVVVNGIDFSVLKSVIEYMYSGETNILDECLKMTVAVAKFFQIKGLQTLFAENQEFQHDIGNMSMGKSRKEPSIPIAAPTFLQNKPKYPTTFRPMGTPQSSFCSLKNPSDSYVQKKMKRKHIHSDAEKACAKEAAASRMALEALQKELAGASHVNSFVVEESCTETTVENFIPHAEENYMQNFGTENVPARISYPNLSNAVLTTEPIPLVHPITQNNHHLQIVTDKIRSALGHVSGNVEFMYKTNSGNFVTVTDDILQNISDGVLQYQLIDENGQVGEVQQLIHVDSDDGSQQVSCDFNRNPEDQVTTSPSELANQEIDTPLRPSFENNLPVRVKSELFPMLDATMIQNQMIPHFPLDRTGFSDHAYGTEELNNWLKVRMNTLDVKNPENAANEVQHISDDDVMSISKDNVPSPISKANLDEGAVINLSNAERKSLPLIDDPEISEPGLNGS